VSKTSGKHPRRARIGALPGFGLTFGYSMFYLSALVILPLSTIVFRPFDLGWDKFWKVVANPRVIASYGVSFSTAVTAASICLVVGTIIAWTLVRYRFPGRRLLEALVDLPFALPTAVAGISFATLWAPNGWLGSFAAKAGITVINTWSGIVIALVFIGFPFVVRAVQPVLAELNGEIEEAAQSLGATRAQTTVRVIIPNLIPSMLTGFILAFARCLGEYGSVVFIAGNLPMKTEIAPILIMSKLYQFDYNGASAIALSMLIMSLLTLVILNALQLWQARRSV